MLEDNADWADKVRIIGLSIDTDEKKLKEWIKEKKYTKVEHYWVRNGQCTADVDFGGVAVPHVLLVDKTGKIVFMGHPALRNLE